MKKLKSIVEIYEEFPESYFDVNGRFVVTSGKEILDIVENLDLQY